MATDADRFDWIRLTPGGGPTCAPPEMESELNAAERILGLRLPASYRAFAMRFGLGGTLHTLPELFRLMPIPGKQDRDWADSVVDAAQFWRSPAAVLDELPAEFLRHAIVFGIDQGAYTYLFHTGEVTVPAAPEYRIYQIPRHEGPEAICDSFEEWLRWIHERYDPALWGEDPEDEFNTVPRDLPRGQTMRYVRFLV